MVRGVLIVDVIIGVVLGLLLSAGLVLLGMHRVRLRLSHWGMDG